MDVQRGEKQLLQNHPIRCWGKPWILGWTLPPFSCPWHFRHQGGKKWTHKLRIHSKIFVDRLCYCCLLGILFSGVEWCLLLLCVSSAPFGKLPLFPFHNSPVLSTRFGEGWPCHKGGGVSVPDWPVRILHIPMPPVIGSDISMWLQVGQSESAIGLFTKGFSKNIYVFLWNFQGPHCLHGEKKYLRMEQRKSK